MFSLLLTLWIGSHLTEASKLLGSLLCAPLLQSDWGAPGRSWGGPRRIRCVSTWPQPSQPVVTVVTGERFQQGTGREKEGRQGVKRQDRLGPPIIAVAIDSQEEKRKWAGVIIREASSNQREGCFEKQDTYTISITSSILPDLEYKSER